MVRVIVSLPVEKAWNVKVIVIWPFFSLYLQVTRVTYTVNKLTIDVVVMTNFTATLGEITSTIWAWFD